MRLKDLDVKELGERFEEALNRAQRLDKQQRIRLRKKIRNELFALMSWDLATPAAVISRWEDRLADVFLALPYGFKDEIARELTERMRSPLLPTRKDTTSKPGPRTP
jgi:hypothetical protein